MQSLNRAAGPPAPASSSRARPWSARHGSIVAAPRPSAAAAASGGASSDGADAPPQQNSGSPDNNSSSSNNKPRRRLSPGDRRRAQGAAVAARRAERHRGLAGRGRTPPKDEAAGSAALASPPLLAGHVDDDEPPLAVDPAALAALEQLEGAVGRLPPRQAAALLSMARTEISARFERAVASVEADGGGQLAALFAAAAAAEREENSGGSGDGDNDGSSFDQRRQRDALVADEALDRAIWDACASRALTGAQRAVLERVVAGVPLRRAPGALARALAGGLDPASSRAEEEEQDGSGEGDEAELGVHAFEIARRLGALTEAEGVQLRRAAAALATTLASLREAAFAVEGAEDARRRFEASLSGMVADAEDEGEDEEDEDEEDEGGDASAAQQQQQAQAQQEQEDQEEEEDLDPLQRRLRAYAKYARVLAEGSPADARALWHAAGGEPSAAFRALKDLLRRVIEVSLVAPELARHEAGRAEAAEAARREALELRRARAAGGRVAEEEQEEDDQDEAAAQAEEAARRAAEAYDAANPDGAELSRSAEKLRAARRALQRRAAGKQEDEGDDDEAAEDDDADDEEEASAAAYRELLAPLTEEEAAATLASLSDELAAILAAIQDGSPAGPPEDKDDKGENGQEGAGRPPRPTSAGRWGRRRAAGADARSAALYLAALTDDDGAFDATPANLSRLCTFLRAAEALEALKALATHSPEASAPDLAYGTARGTSRARAASRAAADAFAERERFPLPGSLGGTGGGRAKSLGPLRGSEAVRMAGLDRDDWWVPAERRARAWAAVRVAELDASFAGRAAAAGSKKGPGGNGRGFGGPRAEVKAKAKAEAKGETQGHAAAASPPGGVVFSGANPYRALLRFADEDRIRELAALDADDLLFLADMERCGWGDDDCLVKWTLHPRVGPRLRATAQAPGGGGVGGSGGGGGFGSAAFFGGLPESLRELMGEARAAAAAERCEAPGGGEAAEGL